MKSLTKPLTKSISSPNLRMDLTCGTDTTDTTEMSTQLMRLLTKLISSLPLTRESTCGTDTTTDTTEMSTQLMKLLNKLTSSPPLMMVLTCSALLPDAVLKSTEEMPIQLTRPSITLTFSLPSMRP